MRKIRINTKGQFGNRLCQTVYALKYVDDIDDTIFSYAECYDAFMNIVKDEKFYKFLEEHNIKYIIEEDKNDYDFLVDDYEQNYFNFDLDKYIKFFSCNEDKKRELISKYPPDEYVVLNVRRGDYLLHRGCFTINNQSWFKKVYNKYFKGLKIVICSNDIEWCKYNLSCLGELHYFDNVMDEFYYMSICKNMALSCSSFTLMALYLNKELKIGKFVIPSPYYGSLLNDDFVAPCIYKEPIELGYLKFRIAVCVMVRNENRYIREWVEYYKSIGFDNILMIDNNDIGGECLADIIGDYINDGFVKMYYRRGDDRVGLQTLNYHEIYELEKDNYEWIAFFDADEFLDMSHFGNDIHNFTKEPYITHTSKVLFKWQLYGDNEQLYYEDKPVQERFPEPLPKDERYVPGTLYHYSMNIVKCMLNTMLVKNCEFKSPHNPYVVSDFPCVTANGVVLYEDVNKNEYSTITDTLSFDNAYLKHYYTKSLEEFFIRRCVFTKKSFTSYTDKINSNYNDYISFNKDTKEKQTYYNRLVNNLPKNEKDNFCNHNR